MAPYRYAPSKKVYRKKYKRRYQKRKQLAMYKSPRAVMPSRYTTTFRYGQISGGAFNGATGAIVGTFRFDPFDTLTSLGTTALSGFTELAAIYSTYRVLRCGYKLKVSNMEDFPIVVTTQVSEFQASASNGSIKNIGNPLAKSAFMSSKYGMDKTTTIKANHSVVSVFGSKEALYAGIYDGLTQGSGTPAATSLQKPVWLTIFVETDPAHTGSAAGIVYEVELSITVNLFGQRLFAN